MILYDKLKIERTIGFRMDTESVYKNLGYRQGQTSLSPTMIDLVDSSLSEALALVNPQGAYIVRRIKDKTKEIKLNNTRTVLKGKSIRSLLINSFAVIFMGVTIGPDLEQKIAQETDSQNLDKALVFDAIGSEAAEASANALNLQLTAIARHSKNFLTTRFSPGYGDLGLDLQQDIYQELALDELGVQIDKKQVLLPNKTITAIIGIES